MLKKKYQIKMLNQSLSADLLAFGFKLSSSSKVGKGLCGFSLPAGPAYTCPGATKLCMDMCYAQKNYFMLNNAHKLMMSNFITFSFYEHRGDVSGAADALVSIIQKDIPMFRINISGDFPSQFYVNVWVEVARQKPDTHFWFYTRSFHLDFSKILALPNMEGLASTDDFNTAEATDFAKKYNIKQAFGPWDKEKSIPAGSFICPATSGKLAVDAACQNCLLCVVKNRTTKNVVFLAH